MKLNKMLALALSGVMAVSMLAGCNGATSDGDEGSSSSQVTVATSADNVMNKAQDKFDFKTSAEHVAALDAAVKELKYADVKAGNLAFDATSGAFKYLQKTLTGAKNVQSNLNKGFTPAKGESNSITVLYKIESKNITEEYALIQVANGIKNVANSDDVVKIGNSDRYNATYTGEVAIVEVSKDDADGKNTESAYYVLLTLTQTVSGDKVTVGT